MKSLFLIFITFFVLSSCGVGYSDDCENSCSSHSNKGVIISNINPFYNLAPGVEGSDFGTFFRTLYRLGRFDDMLSFTSSVSLEEFGRDRVIEFYKNELDFSYEINLNSYNQLGDTIVLNYDAQIFATNKVVRMMVLIENDSCKIVLPKKLEFFSS